MHASGTKIPVNRHPWLKASNGAGQTNPILLLLSAK
jgi:hypothetical protein